MRNYDRVNARKPRDIDRRRAYIVGGGIAGLAAAAFLIKDCHMPGRNIRIFEQLPIEGGSMDGCGDATTGYVTRGDRELEPNMECLWYLCSFIPSLEEPDRTVLDETRESNKVLSINSQYRLVENKFAKRDYSSMGLSGADQDALVKLLLTPEAELENVTIGDWFPESFFSSNLWYFWSSMLAFKPVHSLIEMRRYAIRFIQHLPGIDHLRGILHTKYNQYDSIIAPVRTWLTSQGVTIETDTEVIDLDIDFGHAGADETKTVTGIHFIADDRERIIEVRPDDLVLVTNGSMTQNSTRGSMAAPAIRNNDTEHRGCFTLWEKLAARSQDFGNPAKFIADPEATYWLSWTLTITDYPQLVDYITETTGNQPGTGGIITMVDSAWFKSFHVPVQPNFPNQPDNVQVLWGYGLYPARIGDYVNKPMFECTGEEILSEVLYHMGLVDKIDEIIPHCVLVPTMMPYITSQFMPRTLTDRPRVIPAGSVNLAFIGQFVELPGDVVFTVETSVRTAMTAVYKLLELDRPVTPLYEGQFDIRVLQAAAKCMLGGDGFSLKSLAHDLLEVPKILALIAREFRSVPEINEFDIAY